MIRFATIICLLVGITLPVSAQSSQDTDNLTDLALLTIEELANIAVTIASGAEKTTTTAPSSVSIFSADTIHKMGVRTLEELLQFVPGMYASRQDVFGEYPVARGMRTGLCGNAVLVLVNGVRMNASQCGGAFSTASRLNLMAAERVEIIRGPGSAIYGSNAVAAVINVILDEKDTFIQGSAGSFDSYEAGFSLNTAIADYNLHLHARYNDDKGEKYSPFFNYFGETLPTRDPQKGGDISLKLTRGALSVSSMFMHREYGEFFNAAGGFGDLSGDLRHQTTNLFLEASYQIVQSEKWALKTQIGYRYLEYDFQTPLFPASTASQLVWTNGADVAYIGGNYFQERNLQAAIEGNFNPNDTISVSFGTEFRRETIGRNSFQGNYDNAKFIATGGTVFEPLPDGGRNIGFFGGGGLPLLASEYFLIDATKRNVFGSYVEGDISVSKNLTLTLGARFDAYQSIGSSLSLRGAAVYELTKGTTVKALYGQAFRAPSILEFNGEQLATGAIGNPDLQPEHLDSIELGLVQRLGPMLLSATWFSNAINDGIQLERVDDVLDGVNTFQPQNTGQISNNGWEFEIQASISEQLSLRTGLSHVNTSIDLGIAPTTAFWIASWQQDKLSLTISGYARSKVLAADEDSAANTTERYLSGFQKWNANARYQITDQLEARVTARNLFNNRHEDFSETAGLEGGAPTRGFSITAGLRWTL